jgi:hypothetical protein
MTALAEPIVSDTFLEFSFFDAGIPATGCQPADPGGDFCAPSSGTPTEFLPAPPWTFTADVGGATLTVTDVFVSGDQFEIFDFGTSIGLTSIPVAGLDCGDDPVVCLATPGMSNAIFALAAGPHSITITPSIVPEPFGVGYLMVTGASAAVPEPSTLFLLATGVGLIARAAGRRSAR